MERIYKGVCQGAVTYQSVNLEVRTQSVKRQEAESEVWGKLGVQAAKCRDDTVIGTMERRKEDLETISSNIADVPGGSRQ